MYKSEDAAGHRTTIGFTALERLTRSRSSSSIYNSDACDSPRSWLAGPSVLASLIFVTNKPPSSLSVEHCDLIRNSISPVRMNNKMLHRGPLDRLTTFTHLPVLSTCVLLLIQFQIFHALPTSVASLSSFSSVQTSVNTQEASPSSFVYSPTYSYSSYRPYALQQYAASVAHPNSVYSSQSVSPLSESKLGQLIKERETIQLNNAEKKVTIVEIDQEIPSQKLNRAQQPRLSPLPLPVPENEKKPSEEVLAEEQRSVELSYPPPFAPELDPQYERRQSGLGPISLLDQAGPFW
ncbi:hypothetical protein Ocin01_09192 [Orchesella cincta]|uniref:Uncharacterized protein n=1 Tax=Orchesella cincta TaxID=48709 RepID=A0A1D2MWR5_ORCCI|nr:hypothetical protein Ocin01_09192 [Orchesella cincta]